MSIKASLSLLYAKFVCNKIAKWSNNPIVSQEKVFTTLIKQGGNTEFGKDHNFQMITDYESFKKNVPVKDYEDLKPYIEKIKAGQENILWPGLPNYFSKTSGTTSGAKYIPNTVESLNEQIKAAKNAILCYINETKKTDFVNGKMIFLQGSPELDNSLKVPVGRLSGIVAHHVPSYLQKNRLPSYETNCIDDWETKISAIIKETVNEKMTLISGIPPWVQMYFDKLIETTGKRNIAEIFPEFSLFIYGGVNFEPYRAKFESTIGKHIDSIETYPASEGFIAFQDSQKEEGLLLNINAGIFFEFIPADEYFDENPSRISLKDVELNKNYALILNTNAGLWGYSIGDTVKFVSLNPYRIVVSGRIKHFTSAFGEHVIGEEVDYALQKATEELKIEVKEYHVAPQVNPPEGGIAYHEWFVEFTTEGVDLKNIANKIDTLLQGKNSYYKDLRIGDMLSTLKITPLKPNAFNDYMKSIGKLGGQNKLPRLSNDRKIADELTPFKI
ncbi:GH3 auxin-responsive promoter family protein [Vicingus serpentipes]|jgi:GH3 auxin-responsive promoter|uniref:GH3 auxin-responsive promoter family protein n=1 Tax=Vicingus serpentipes TaxID=1926625 RepID=A0A5C6RQS6_9FLAO|nr:GH3 auxin-responsive promoter family protein [Vicingus serpentipes]TXB64618.1 GH3 auxin-responsive promoter family protein [Vicingus serpentipes]